MKSFLGFALLALVSLGSLASGQQMSAEAINGPFQKAARGGNQIPVTSPEPSTLAALFGGAVIAGGIAARRRKNQARTEA